MQLPAAPAKQQSAAYIYCLLCSALLYSAPLFDHFTGLPALQGPDLQVGKLGCYHLGSGAAATCSGFPAGLAFPTNPSSPPCSALQPRERNTPCGPQRRANYPRLSLRIASIIQSPGTQQPGIMLPAN